MSEIQVDNQTIELGKPDKVLFPDIGFTKQDMADYYQRVAVYLLPHLKNRPISMKRFPDGIKEGGFYQKEIPDYFPGWIDRAEVEVKEDNEKQAQVVINHPAALVFLCDQANISIHTWLSKRDKIDYPDKIIFDLDPPNDDFDPIRKGAKTIRKLINDIGLTPFVMTTGSRGLHVMIPIERYTSFDDAREFAKRAAHILARQNPESLTAEISKSKRKGRLFLDYLRNSYGQTSVSPYSLRAKKSAPVATPLAWEELDEANLTSQKYHAKNIFRRLGQKNDAWENFLDQAGDLKQAAEKLKEMT